MARQPQVTRTIITTKVTALCVNVDTKTTENREFVLPRTYKDENALLKALKKRVEACTEDGKPSVLRAVHVIDAEEVETLYGMSEDDFIAHATVLPPRTKCTDDTDTDDTVAPTNEN